MKKAILCIVFALISAVAIAQSKPDTAKKQPPKIQKPAVPEFNPDKAMSKFLMPGLQAGQVNDYFFLEDNGQSAIDHSSQLLAIQATTINENHRAVADTLKTALRRKFTEFMRLEKKHFDDSVKMAADTLKGKPKKTNH